MDVGWGDHSNSGATGPVYGITPGSRFERDEHHTLFMNPGSLWIYIALGIVAIVAMLYCVMR